MTTPIRFTRIVARLTVAAALGLSVTPCVMSPAFAEDAPNIDAIPASPELSAFVPEFYRQKQPITVAVNPEIAPVKFINEDGDVAGFAPDLISAAAKAGVENQVRAGFVRFVNSGPRSEPLRCAAVAWRFSLAP